MGELSRPDIIRIAQLTRGQRDNSLWHELRQCRLTGSKFGEIAKQVRLANPDLDRIRSEFFTPKDLSGIPATNRVSKMKSMQSMDILPNLATISKILDFGSFQMLA